MENDFWLSAEPNASMLYCCIPSVPPTSSRPVTTPGTRPAMTHGLRPVGIASYRSSVMFVCVTVLLTSTTGDSPLTVTVSCSVADPQLDIEAGEAGDLDRDAVALERREARDLVHDLVLTGRQRRELVGADAAGHGRPRAADQRRARCRHRDAGQHAALRVAHHARQRAGLLGPRVGRRHQRRQHQDDGETMEHRLHGRFLSARLGPYLQDSSCTARRTECSRQGARRSDRPNGRNSTAASAAANPGETQGDGSGAPRPDQPKTWGIAGVRPRSSQRTIRTTAGSSPAAPGAAGARAARTSRPDAGTLMIERL